VDAYRNKYPMSISRRHIIYISLGLVTAVFAGALVGFFFALTHELPQIEGLEKFKPAAITRIYSADKELLAELFTERRQPVPLAEMPSHLKNAIIATEDAKFYDHPGVDIQGILRATIRNIMAGEYAQGASTITQQLAKILFLTPRKAIMRKLKEAFLAFQIERRYTKDEILEFYLNQVYFGSGAYGVGAAAQMFFGKSVHNLTLSECALVAGMPKLPSRYSPLVNKSLAEKRRNIVLRQMAQRNLISYEKLEIAKASPIDLVRQDATSPKAPYFVAWATNFLEKELGGAALYRRGLNVYTTLDYTMQKAAKNAVAYGLKKLSTRMNLTKRNGLPQDDSPQAALVCLDVRRGAILAMVGGRDFQQSPFNRATMARRQPGSAFKPLVYALAIKQGFTQGDLLWDAPVVYRGAHKGKDWSPMNFSGKFMGEITLRKALALSKNIPAVKLLNKLGSSHAIRFSHTMGIKSHQEPNLSLVLGTSEVTLLELTSAYAVFPDGGVWTKPFGIIEVLDRQNRSVWRQRPQSRSVISPETAAVVTDMLKAVVMEGTGRAARSLGRPLAGKTGSTDSYKDALFIGFSPTIALGVWVGLDHHGSLGSKETGARAALPIWINFMEQVLQGRPYQDFDLPEGVVEVEMDVESGLLAAKNCLNMVTAVFKKGSEPQEYCKHREQGPWKSLNQ